MLSKNRLCALIICIISVVSIALLFGCNPNDLNGNEILSVNKKEYLGGEEIYFSAKGEQEAWIGLYREIDDVSKVEAIRHLDVCKNGFVSGETYAFRRCSAYNESRQAFRNIPRGRYKLILFNNRTDNKILQTVKFSVSKESLALPQAPQSVVYKLDNVNDGLADGVLDITFGENSCAEEVVLYWADENGALPDYTCLAPFFVTSRRFSFRMYANTVIPSDATRLLAYGKNSLGTSADYCEVVLPADCQYKFGGKLITEFQVVSDVHIAVADTHLASADAKQLHDAHFLAMCNDIVSNSPQSSGVFVVGDMANSGRDYEWKHANELIASVARLPKFYFSLGNHDLYGSESYFTLAQNFMTYAQTDSVYYERVIDGYYHLFLGSESKSNGLDADLSQNQLSWFDNRMQELTASRPNKPVFVYLHQSLYDTIAGSFEGQGWDGIIQNEQFRSIVAKYPQIYMFNGHSHWDMNTRGSMHDKSDGLPNIFNTASVAYLWSSYYIPTGEYLRGSQGYYVRVYENKVLVLGRDFENAKWIPSACFEAVV